MEGQLVLYRSSRIEALAERLVDSLRASQPADPVVAQEVVVGSRGMERWLRNRIATLSDGRVCCNVEFPFPETAIQRRIDERLGGETAHEVWRPDVLAWRGLSELRAPGAAARDSFLGDWLDGDRPDPGEPADSVGRATWVLARDVADVMDRLLRFRPDWLRDGSMDDEAPLAPWLLELWRALERELPASHHAARLAALDAQPVTSNIARPLHVFGFSSFPPSTLQALRLLARHGPVEIFAFVPSEAWWADFQSHGQLKKLTAEYRSRDRDELAEQLRQEFASQHPLLTGLGRLSRDFQALVENELDRYHEPDWDDGTSEEDATSLLEQLQHSVRQAQWPREATGAPTPADDSIQVHACHGPQRQVEVLRETLLDLLERDRTLQPREILVMTPDLETYAPLMTAVFQQGVNRFEEGGNEDPWGPGGAPRIPLQVSDLGIRRLNPVADALLRVLAFAEGRMTASKLMDLLTLFPVRDRFEINAQEVDRVRHWIATSGLRWGLDADDRARAGQPEDAANTLQFALERLALGVVQADDPSCWDAGTAPVDELEGSAVGPLGQPLQFLRPAAAWCERLRPPASPTEWAQRLRSALEAVTVTEADTSFLTAQVLEAFEALATEAETGGFEGPLRLSAVRHWLEGRLEAPGGGDRPITGAVTVSAMMPMRSVPFRVIALVGMDDGAFPRRPVNHGFDPTQRHPRLGDRDARDEDRHLFLEALLSARDHLIITYTGRDVRTNEALPPSGVIHELLDVLERGWPSAEEAAPPLVRQHPLQPFSPGPFALDESEQMPQPYGAGNRTLAARIADRRGAPDTGVFTNEAALAHVTEPGGLTLEALERALRHPNRQLLRARLGLELRDWSDLIRDHEPVDLDALEQWQLRADLLERSIDATRNGRREAPGVALERLRAEGRIALGAAGKAWVEQQLDRNAQLTEAAAAPLTAPHRAVEIALDLGGQPLTGRVEGCLSDEPLVVACVHDDPLGKASNRLHLWIRTLAVTAQTGVPHRGALYGIASDKVRVLEIAAPDDAHAELANLVGIWRDSLTRPLRLAEKTSFAFAQALSSENWQRWAEGAPLQDLEAALQKADEAWEDGYLRQGEGAEPELGTNFGREPIHRTAEGAVHPEFLDLAGILWRPQLEAESGE